MSVAELHHAILNGNTNQVRQLITLGADVNQKYGQETAFSLAIQQNQFQCADQGADINAINNQGMTPLSVSTWHGTYHCTKLLLDHGALLTIHDKSGRTPLMIACSNVYLEVVKVIIHYGCDVSILDPDMRSALIYALPTYYARHVGQKKLSDMISICELIINTGCDLNKQDRKGWTALHHAVDRDCVTSLCLLVQNNCHLDVQDKSGYTPLHLCLKKTEPNFEMAQLLVYYGAKAIHLVPNTNFINDTNSQGLTPLQTAVNMGQFHTAEVLIKHGAMANDSLSPYPMIHLAAASGATSFVHLLLSSGVDPNMTDQLGNTPLHVAASKGNEYLMLDIPVPALYTHEALAAMDILDTGGIGLHQDKEKTAFRQGNGLWQFTVMPFGCPQHTCSFERLMEHILRGLNWKTPCFILMT
ncbi:hypothetical protein Btru_023605 [Bulinus truncatus]|nr:hypothetical protein Btru_023605 [Bulinus truncatus]